MLDERNAGNVSDASWNSADRVARLPMAEAEFFSREGAYAPSHNSRRSFHRFYFRGKALLERSGKTLGVFTTDLSRKGMGLLSPVQLFPKERVVLQLGDRTRCQLEIVRCRRNAQDCYECGSRFVVGVRINEITVEVQT